MGIINRVLNVDQIFDSLFTEAPSADFFFFNFFQNALICWIFNFVVVEVHSNECEESVKLDDAKECEPFLWVRHYFWLSLDYGDESERYIL